MTVDEIYSQIAQHMIEGLMVHSQLADYYSFLGFEGYSKCHKYHYFLENANYKKICDYYLHHYNKLIIEKPFKNPGIIPETWYKYTRQDVNGSTKKSSVQTGLEKWVEWEKETKTLYENMFMELMSLGEVAGAMELKKYIIDVDDELAEACQKHIDKKGMDFDLPTIIAEQKEICKKYDHKLKNIDLLC